MIVAIYARKSTDQNVADEEKSVTRQVERARAFAARQGWTVAEEHIYTDDAISGAEFVRRPAFLRLMAGLKPRPPFQALIVMEQSRLGRSLDEVPYALKRITDAGVAVWSYLTETEMKRESAADKFMIHAIAFVDDMAREQSRERTRDALARKAERGHVAGGVVYGYVNRRRAEGHVVREIDPAQAAVVRRLFEMAAAGKGILRIAKALNAEGVTTPRRNGRGWAPSAIREMLHRDLYRGLVVWGKTRRVDRDGQTGKKAKRPESEWRRREKR